MMQTDNNIDRVVDQRNNCILETGKAGVTAALKTPGSSLQPSPVIGETGSAMLLDEEAIAIMEATKTGAEITTKAIEEGAEHHYEKENEPH
jgi:hypothetical protein